MNSNDMSGTGAVQLHFCDLCNESVPQTDIDQGRATLIKGRVVCATCNHAMSHADAAQAQPAAAQPAHAANATASHAREPVRSGSSAGFFAFVALCAAGGVGFWSYREIDGLRSRSHDEMASRLDAQREQRDVASATEKQLRAELVAVEQRSSEALSAQAKVFAAQLERAAANASDAQARLAKLTESIAALEAAQPDSERQAAVLADLRRDQVALEQRLAATLDRLEGEVKALREGAAAPPPAAPEAKRPEWFALVEDLKSPASATRWRAVLGLGQSKDPAAAEHLVPVLKDEDIFVRMFAARTLGDLGNPNSVSALIDALEDPEVSVRAAAFLAVKAITKRDLPFDAESTDVAERQRRVKAWREWWEKERGKLGA